MSSSDRKVMLFRTHHVYATDIDDIFKVEASLILQPYGMSYYVDGVSYSSDSHQVFYSGSEEGALSFEVEGFWSMSSGNLCMVGSGSTYREEGKHGDHTALLKLQGVKSSTTIHSLVRGTLDSLSSADDSSYFNSISLLMFPSINYKYTEVPKEPDLGFAGAIDVPKNSSLSLPLTTPICSIFTRSVNSFGLEYAKGCNSGKGCNPLGESVGYLPQVMSLNLIHCSDDRKSLRFLVEFPNSSYVDYYRPFNPNTSLVAEGSWDAEKNRLCIVACRILNYSVEDCSIRLSLRFPAVLSIRNTSGILGHLWSSKKVKDSGYFNRVMFQSSERNIIEIPGRKYEYTLVDKARKSLPKKKENEGRQYPDGSSYDMRFDMSVKNSSGKRIGWGNAYPIFVGDKIARNNMYYSVSFPDKAKSHHSSPLKISYEMSFPSFNSSSYYTKIAAEGVYDAETGELCMVGCRYLDSSIQILANESMDCEILVNIHFPPVDSNEYIKGKVRSTREKVDLLHFESLSFTAVSYSGRRSRESIWRMDLEILMALISNAVVCVAVRYQLLYVKKHPNVFPFISILMLVVLTLGQMIPLLLNFEALFLPKENGQTLLLRSGGWLEVNEMIVRVVTMVAFLLQCRLLLLVWSAKLADGNHKASWVAEKKTIYITLPLYTTGALIAFFVNWRNYRTGQGMNSTLIHRGQNSIWVDFKSYSGLILDGFLFPQILLNIFQNSRENALSRFFYLGTTFARLLPHTYDLYRARNFDDDFGWSYMYANPSADYYSTAWDVIIPLGGLLFAAIIYLQQRSDGSYFLPRRFMQTDGYEKVAVAMASDDGVTLSGVSVTMESQS